MRAILALGLAAAAASAEAAGGAAGHAGIPWGEILKQAVNFSILVGVLVYLLRKPLSSFLRERSELLRKSIEDASRTRRAAAEKLEAIEARLSGLSREVEEMNRRMDADAEEEAARLRASAQAELARIGEQVRFAADQEVKKAREELRTEAAGLSTAAAAEILAMTITPEDQDRMVRENIEEIREFGR